MILPTSKKRVQATETITVIRRYEPDLQCQVQTLLLLLGSPVPEKCDAGRATKTKPPVGDTEGSQCEPGVTDQAAATASIPTRQRRRSD